MDKKRFFDAESDDDILAKTTNYLCNEFLDAADLKVFETMKKNNPRRYKVAGLGDWGIVDGLVFENWEEKPFNIEEVKKIKGTKDEVVFLSVDFTSSNLDKIYVFKANTKNISEVNMRTICLSECIKNNGNAMPTPFNAVMSDNEYYFQSFNSLAYCDISTEKSNTLDSLTARCREIIKEGKFKPDFEKAIIPIGSYKGIVLINVPISTDTDLENLVCAVSNNKIIGSIHLKKNGIWDIRKGEKSISSVFDVSDKNLYVKFYEYLNFPKY